MQNMRTVSGPSVDKLYKQLADKMEVGTGFGSPVQKERKLVDFFKAFDGSACGDSQWLTRAEFHTAMTTFNFVGCNLEISALFSRYGGSTVISPHPYLAPSSPVPSQIPTAPGG